MNNLILTILVWYFYNFIEYIFHRLGHSKKYGGIIYKLHMTHHRINYPFNEPIKKKPYRTNNTYYIPDGYVAYIPPSILLVYILFKILNLYTFLYIITEIIIITYPSNYIHNEIHIKNSWLEKYKWFLYCRNQHIIHHKNPTVNFSFSGLDNNIDRLFGTYRSPYF